jgi:hypothetical protein
MTMDRDQLYDGTKDLLERLADRLPEQDLETLRSLHDVGEPIHLLDYLCAGLVRWRTGITQAERDALAVLVSDLVIPEGEYSYLDAPDRTLAALNVVT